MDSEKFDMVVHENEIQSMLYDVCQELEIEDLKKENQRRWKAVLKLVGDRLFKNTGILKQESNIYNACAPSNCNAYDYVKVNELCDYYILLGDIYSKLPSIVGFAYLSGIDPSTIELWKDNEPSSISFKIWKKLSTNREDCLKDKLYDSNNPVGQISIGNTEMGWNMPGVRNDSPKREQIAASDAKERFKQWKIEQQND